MYGAIVIGAGPTGCTAAKTLAEKGNTVLLVEKFRMPRYKSCSGILIKKSMDLVETYFGEKVPASAMCTPTQNRGMIFTDDKGKEYRFEQEGLNIWRSHFDGWLAEKAKESGAQVRDGVSVLSCTEKDGFVEVSLRGEKETTECARYVIDCEGVVGTLKRRIFGQISTASKGQITAWDGGRIAANPAEKSEYITTFQTFNEGRIDLDPHYFYAYLQPEFSQYDAWFNVKEDLLVLGVSVKNRDKITYYYKQFIDHMKENHDLRIDRQTKEEKWLMPRIRPGCHVDYGVGRILFAGEVAGFLNPMGEGISAGMESGHCAACAVLAHFDDPESVREAYRKSTKDLQSYMRRQWSLVGGMAGTFSEMA